MRAEVHSLKDLKTYIKDWSEQLGSKEIVLLSGPMGAGKSQLVNYLVESLGGGTQSHSPTFSLHNTYSTESSHVDHLDLYRLESEEDLESSGFWDLFDQEKAIICIEWADRLPDDIFPPSWGIFKLKISKDPENSNAEFRWIESQRM
ncbi:MAG: tRNA (adenosine(37)-N6)-threonylcarbamoyltransferase complex ATPase subunit type 1 TsaE [Bdellovibrionales bacterium]